MMTSMARCTVRRIVLSAALAACAALVVGSGCPFVPPAVKTILEQADERAKTLDPDAVIVSANGVNGASLGAGGSQTLSYEFLAIDPQNPSTAWKLTYDLSNWSTTAMWFPPVGIEYYDLLGVSMTEDQVRDLLDNAGFNDDFFGWSLQKPLNPAYPDPLYSFTYANMYVQVNTRTQTIIVSLRGTTTPLAAAPGAGSVSVERIAAANTEIKKTDADAFIIWAGGRDANGDPLQAPADTNVWDFYAVALGETTVKAWSLAWDGSSWTVTQLPWPPLQIEFLDLTSVTMDVVEAWNLAVQAGYSPPFDWWVVFKSLHPSVADPHYVFLVNGVYVFVNTVTNEVTQE